MSVEIGTFEEFVSAAHVNRMGIVSDLIRFNFLYPQQRDATGSFYVKNIYIFHRNTMCVCLIYICPEMYIYIIYIYNYIYINTYMIMVT